ncbi:UDP-N-acetylmuramate dehydrogenase [Paenibacillus thermoaerophilus]|uniref:UDP-N-acetylenolpyruvoylglucosamine reductase n=1 Tax=Paenibacillus thermoaerophilus TaxID=1215385 RepID=A0ABW2V048_9BACL|nr:UDP-N-acetylmuramate dehydrogenase [Paenibacillus thermoaerophilus]TMV19080.1 UDP-N-acetylmuramate dehydrogenase [Paenibacillus thermoaerophilus]
MQQVYDELEQRGLCQVKRNEPLAGYTTWKIGGPADALLIPGGKRQLAETLSLLREAGVPWFVLGRGSNLLVSDKGVRGAVICLGRNFSDVRIEGDVVTAGGAKSLITLSVMAGKEGLTGLEFAGGIPGTVGGAVYMNAGAHGSDVSRILKQAEIVRPTGELAVWSAEELQFGYRYSRLHEQPGIVVEAVFQLQTGDRKEIAARMASNKDRRLRTQPLQLACAGSTFRNPEGDFAARLIEEAGLKGVRVGDAEVSPLHANFIVNTGQASAEDVLALMDLMRTTVRDKFGIDLVPEVLMIGER